MPVKFGVYPFAAKSRRRIGIRASFADMDVHL